jgi:hypothetical protein
MILGLIYYNMRTWKNCIENPTEQEISNGMYKYALEIASQANTSIQLENLANNTNKKSDKNRASKAIDEFYSMREAFNEW